MKTLCRAIPAVLTALVFDGAAALAASPGPQRPVGLMCELMEEPGLTRVTDPRPSFSWVVSDSRRGAVQKAFEILVASSKTGEKPGKGDGWDSGKIAAATSTGVRYSGPALRSDTDYTWTVRTWDGSDLASPWAQPQRFHTGQLGTEDRPTRFLPANQDFADRYPLESTEVAPVRVVDKGMGRWFVDFGRDAFGTVRVSLDSPAAGALEIHLGEVAGPGGESINEKPGGSRRFRSIQQPVVAGSHEYLVRIPSDAVNTRATAVHLPSGVPEATPFRYCEIVGYPGELDSAKIRQVALHYHFNDRAGGFRSSDETLNAVWDLCRYSMKATSYLGVYVDGDRERTAYEADAFINQLGHYCVDREYTLARHSLQYLLLHPTWPVEWQQHDVLMAWEDWLYTGDDRILRSDYAILSAKTLQALGRGDGLIVTDARRQDARFLQSIHMAEPLRPNVDWPLAERDGHQATPVDSVENAFYYRSLVLMGGIARALGRDAEAAEWDGKAARVYDAFQRVFYDSATGLYRDGESVRHSSQHANFFPLAFGLVPEDRKAAVTRFVISRGMACSVYGAQYLLDALYAEGADKAALALLTSQGKRSWYNMIRAGSTIAMEAWDDSFKPNQDWNHAWGAAPANLIPRRLMGIRPIEPGFRRCIIEPRVGALSHASITVPTIRGPVSTQVDQSPSAWTLTATIPANMSALVSLPTTDPAAVTEGGLALKRSPFVRLKGVSAGRTLIEVPAGTYDFSFPQNSPNGSWNEPK